MAENPAEDEDTFRILIATDTHVGFNEKDRVRGKDAFNTFEEVLQIARAQRADFMLHGGDLFHENKPSRSCLYQTMDLLRRYCLGPGEVRFQVVSDPAVFARGLVNYEDPNTNVDMPLFMIHGNHDDPGGETHLCAANLLEVASLVNYFGRSEDLDDIVVKPVLMKKGRTQLAIYGLGNVRDERLHRAFHSQKVRFETPVNPEQWFNIMILHQNRHKGNKGGVPTKGCIHEEMLPNFLDLVIWAHEHDCEVSPQESLRGEFYVVQPGSSVATSLIQGETGLKHVALIEVRTGCFKSTPMPLWTVRPLVMRETILSDTGLLRTDTQGIWNALASEIDAMIAQGEEETRRRKHELNSRGNSNLEVPMLPLVRLRVEHTGFDTIGIQSFGQQFSGRVANPDAILNFHRHGGGGSAGSTKKFGVVGDALAIEEGPGAIEDGDNVQDIIYKYIEGAQNLQILSEPDLNDAVQSFVHRSEPCAIERFVREAVEATNRAVLQESRAVGEEEIRVQIQDRAESLRQHRLNAAAAGAPAVAPTGATAGAPATMNGSGGHILGTQGGFVESVTKNEQVTDIQLASGMLRSRTDLMEDFEPQLSANYRGRGGRGGRGGRAPRGRNAEKRPAPKDEVADIMAPPAVKFPRSHQARASGAPSATTTLPQGRGARELLFGAAGPPASETAAPATAAMGMPTHSLATAAAATPFLQKRAVATNIEAAWGNDDAGHIEPATKRQWALRG